MLLKNQKGFKFTEIKELDHTDVKHQAKSSTCWSFATISFIESELLRLPNKQMGNEPLNLSEMFVVRKTYPRKAEHYVRMHGSGRFGGTSLAGDVLRVAREHGLVPEGNYDGLLVGDSEHNHDVMDAVLKALLDTIIKKKGRHLSKWPETVESILDIYLGKVPESFDVDGKDYTPEKFAKHLKINNGFSPDDYIELSSFTHRNPYEEFILQVPDNWGYNQYFNLPLDEFMEVIDHAIENECSLVWDGDNSEKSYSHELGVAILPLKEWNERTEEEKENICKISEPEIKPEDITPKVRQKSYDNQDTTDDHLIHIIGTAEDQHGTKFYKAKNSWGKESNKFDGYIYLSESYIRSKTISVMLHKDGLPDEIAKKIQATEKQSSSI